MAAALREFAFCAILLVSAPLHAQAFFEELFGGGGGGGGMQFQMGGQQVRAPKWPKGTPEEVSKQMSWLKGTEWKWNRDGWSLKLEKDGDVEAPIQQCRGSSCKWSAENGKLYILLGDAGLLKMDAEASKPARMEGIKMVGRLQDGQKITLTFDKIFDFEGQDLDKDLYADLGIPEDADDATIKKVYRKLSIKYHPDKNPDAESAKKFAEIRDAYEVLNDPDKKILYDTGGMEAVKKGDKGQVEKTEDVEAETTVTLKELYLGSTKQASINRRIVCRGCHVKPNAPQCKGCGRCPNEVKVVNVQMGPFMTQQQQEVPSKQKCKTEDTVIEINIEKGMRDGDKLNFPRMASQRPGMIPGQVNLQLKAEKHPKFVRKGDDLYMDMHVSLRESLLGWTQTIRHIDGHTLELTSKDVTKHLQIIKVKSEGMPLRDDPASFGSLYVKVHVSFPAKLKGNQRELIEKVFAQDPVRNEL